MATTFKINYSAQAIPIEVVTLADGSDTTRVLNSNVDTSMSGGVERSYPTTATNIKYKASYTPGSSYVALSDAAILNGIFDVDFLMIKIISTGATDEIALSFDSGSTQLIGALGSGDVILIPQLADSQSTTTFSATVIQIKKVTGTPIVQILAGIKL